MRPRRKKTDERGFALIIAYLVVLLVSIFSLAFFTRHQIAIQTSERYQNRILSFNAAESGIDYALRELATSATRRAETADAIYTSAEIPLTQHSFRYVVSPVPDKTTMRRIDATGCAPSCTSPSRAQQTSAITVYSEVTAPTPPAGMFEYGIYTTGKIELNGTTFDSYNSNQGGYGGSNISSDGAIAGNTTAIEGIELDSSTVRGSVVVAEDGNPSTVIESEHSTITNGTGNLPSGWALSAPPPLASQTYTDIDLSNITSARTLAAGVYHCSSIHISGSKGAIVTSGAVKIYVDGAVSITGQGTTVANNKPGNLHIYVTGSSPVGIRGNGSFVGGVYAPNSDVTFQTSNSGKGGTWFGAVVAKTFTSYGGGAPALHFDLAMKENQPVDPNQVNIVRVTAWQEMNSLAWDTGTAVAAG